MPATKRSNRKEQILQALAQMLETNLGQRITTAKLAAEVGVSEAALYRHFPSKARMFEGLIEFTSFCRRHEHSFLLVILSGAVKNPSHFLFK